MKHTEVALALALLPSLGLMACAQQEAQQESSSMEMAAVDMEALGTALNQVGTAWKQAYEAGDAAALADLYTDDAIYLAPYHDALSGRAAIQAAMAEQIGESSGRTATIDRTDYGGSGDLAYSIGTYAVELQMADAPAPVNDRGKYVTLVKRGADGSWKIYAHIWNTSLPEADVAKMLSSMNM